MAALSVLFNHHHSRRTRCSITLTLRPRKISPGSIVGTVVNNSPHQPRICEIGFAATSAKHTFTESVVVSVNDQSNRRILARHSAAGGNARPLSGAAASGFSVDFGAQATPSSRAASKPEKSSTKSTAKTPVTIDRACHQVAGPNLSQLPTPPKTDLSDATKKLIATIPDDLPIPGFLKRPPPESTRG
jgi:hypothetical protein